jgi:hypothetical protein
MNAARSAWLARFAADIAAATEAQLRSDITLGGKLLLGSEGRLQVCYAPFEHVGEAARVVLLGITPGRQQAFNALLEVRLQILAGADHTTALAAAKSFASFSGPLRSNLVASILSASIPGSACRAAPPCGSATVISSISLAR